MYQIVNYYHENNQKILEHRLRSRSLWDDHISYTRNMLISSISGLGDVEVVSQRLLRNAEDVGNFISPYYSTQQVTTFVELLQQHMIIANDVIKGTDPTSEERWRMNGRDLMAHMYQMNPLFWPTTLTDPLWSRHLDLTIGQVAARKSSVWPTDVASYDENHLVINEFSDIFSKGMIYQNIGSFCSYVSGV